MADIVLTNCRIVTPEGVLEGGIAITGGKISAMASNAEDLPPAPKRIDVKSNHVIPGVIDAHCHVGWPDWQIEEAYRRDSEAAALGGVTTIIDRATLPPGSLVEQIFGDGMRKDLLEKNAHVDVALQACIFTDDHIGDIPQLVERGIVGFKFYLPYKGSEVVPPQVGIDDGIVYVGFEKIAQCGKPAHAQIHAENVEIFFKLKERFLKEEREVSWYDTRPNLCEIESILRCGYFAKITGCPVYVVHMSTKEGPEIVGRLRGEGVDIVAETCPQYLVCTKDNTHRILGKVNPPLRTKEDNESLWEGIRRGLVTTLGSDHAPCLKRHKAEFWSAVVGMAGVQTLLPVMLSEGVNKGRITLEKLVEIACYNNAKQFGLFPRKGAIRVGSDADLVIIDLKKTVKIEVEKLRQLSDFSPYEGWEITGWPVLTMVRGKIVMEDGQLTAEPGYGRFIPAERSS